MIEFELDGKKVRADSGSTILEVALKNNAYVPHFCYHKKLSIAANCRMCLVEVEKAPKPLPACATPVTEGMKVHTCSKFAVEAQKGVMEFLLINHPLDCPICDQGGECQLQDLAVGYGKSESRFEEAKRVVSNKDLGPLVSTEMTRCIHCSRCVRFTDEIAGYQELGMSYRNNHVEIMPFIGKTVDSEISGNIIDICPVGALTSKPFRNMARSWELSRRRSVSPHDSLGSNLIVQVDKYHKVVRVLPYENEQLNECWISDRDRFSYEGLYHEDRVVSPKIKQDGKWIDVSWEVALEYTAKSIVGVKAGYGVNAIGVLAGETSTNEELYLLKKLMHQLGVFNLDTRLNQVDFVLDNMLDVSCEYKVHLGGNLEQFTTAENILLIASVLRQEQPVLAAKVRHAVKHGTKLHVVSVLKEDLLCNLATQLVYDPREIVYFMAQVLKQINPEAKSIDLSDVEISLEARDLVDKLRKGTLHIVMGEMARSLPNYATLYVIVAEISATLKARYGIIPAKGNSVGAQVLGFNPTNTPKSKNILSTATNVNGINTYQMLKDPRKCYVLFNTELEYDSYDSNLALKALSKAETVVAFSSYQSPSLLKYADVILPITPFTETAGSFINLVGFVQKFNGATKPLGESKPGWKVLRVLANYLSLHGFEYGTVKDIQEELDLPNEVLVSHDVSEPLKLTSKLKVVKPNLHGFIRVGVQNIYDSDPIVRRAFSLQQTKLANQAILMVSVDFAKEHQFNNGDIVRVSQADYFDDLTIKISDQLVKSSIYLAPTAKTQGFSGRFDQLYITKALNQKNSVN